MKTVCVMMSTYNGEKYVKEQIKSVLHQKDTKVMLMIRDDGSSDKTVDVIKQATIGYNNVVVKSGENTGYIKSFLTLLKNAAECDYYAFCDQDDVWKTDKLISAIKMIEKDSQDFEKPILYTSALECTDSNLNPTRIQNFPNLKLNFYSEFVRHRFAGCTYVFNKSLFDIATKSDVEKIICPHDTLLALIAWASGGKVVYDDQPHIFFRRHGTNASIDGMGLKRRIIKEFSFVGKGKNYKYNVAKMMINVFPDQLDTEYKAFLKEFSEYKESIRKKVSLLRNEKLDCGMRWANILFKLGMIINSI